MDTSLSWIKAYVPEASAEYRQESVLSVKQCPVHCKMQPPGFSFSSFSSKKTSPLVPRFFYFARFFKNTISPARAATATTIMPIPAAIGVLLVLSFASIFPFGVSSSSRSTRDFGVCSSSDVAVSLSLAVVS